MRSSGLLLFLSALLLVGCIAGSAHAADLSKAKGTVDNIKQADPPKVSTGTVKGSPVGQPVSEYKPPAAPSLKIKEPPAPSSPKTPSPKK